MEIRLISVTGLSVSAAYQAAAFVTLTTPPRLCFDTSTVMCTDHSETLVWPRCTGAALASEVKPEASVLALDEDRQMVQLRTYSGLIQGQETPGSRGGPEITLSLEHILLVSVNANANYIGVG